VATDRGIVAGCSSESKSSRLIIAKYFANWIFGELYVAGATGILNYLGLEEQDQDSKGKTKTEAVRVKTETKTVTLKTKTVKILPRDEAVPRGFPSVTKTGIISLLSAVTCTVCKFSYVLTCCCLSHCKFIHCTFSNQLC